MDGDCQCRRRAFVPDNLAAVGACARKQSMTITRLRDILPNLPVVFGLPEPEAAASVGVSVSKFRELVGDGRMPRPRRIDGRIVFDVDELRAAFKAIPHEAGGESDTWVDLK
jgi:predicted DNA-binding transcriptional regulator AlpA